MEKDPKCKIKSWYYYTRGKRRKDFKKRVLQACSVAKALEYETQDPSLDP